MSASGTGILRSTALPSIKSFAVSALILPISSGFLLHSRGKIARPDGGHRVGRGFEADDIHVFGTRLLDRSFRA
jgi:hypothetical protein